MTKTLQELDRSCAVRFIQARVPDVVPAKFRNMLRFLGYKNDDCRSWAPYIYDRAVEYHVPVHVAVAAFKKLGYSHAFTAFIYFLIEYARTVKDRTYAV